MFRPVKSGFHLAQVSDIFSSSQAAGVLFTVDTSLVLQRYYYYTVKKVRDFPVTSRDITDGEIASLFLQCSITQTPYRRRKPCFVLFGVQNSEPNECCECSIILFD
jgi:hypothetical protein